MLAIFSDPDNAIFFGIKVVVLLGILFLIGWWNDRNQKPKAGGA